MALFGEIRVVPVVLAEGKLVALSEADSLRNAAPAPAPKKHLALGQFLSTAIPGNDLLSSCLYTAGLAATVSGPLAPVCLFTVNLLLHFYRFIYAEIVTAIPVNGGSYNGLLNVSSKRVAAAAAALSLLTYCSTAVVSAVTSMNNLQLLWPALDVRIGTVVLLAVFAALAVLGVGDSAYVALSIFSLHVVMMLILIVWCFVATCQNGWVLFAQNWQQPFPDIYDSLTGDFIMSGNAGTALVFGYASAALGITGFETAANFVEEMASNRIYVYTLRNMLFMVTFFNPTLSLMAMGVLPLSTIYSVPAVLLAQMGYTVGGQRLGDFVVVDAVIVLAGGVLTSYVGIMGLGKRLSTDGILPAFLMRVNRLRGTPHWTIIAFFVVASSLFLVIFDPHNLGSINALGLVFSISFLSVMLIFGVCCVLLKVQRPELPRLVVASWGTVFAGICLVLVGLIASVILAPSVVRWFFIYLSFFAVIIIAMFLRVHLLRLAMWVLAATRMDHAARARAAQRVVQLQAAHDAMEARRTADHLLQQRALHGCGGDDAVLALPVFFGDDTSPAARLPAPSAVAPAAPQPLLVATTALQVAPPEGVTAAMARWLQRARRHRGAHHAAAGPPSTPPSDGAAPQDLHAVWDELAGPAKRHAAVVSAGTDTAAASGHDASPSLRSGESAASAPVGAAPLASISSAVPDAAGCSGRLYGWLSRQLAAILTAPVVFLAKTNDLSTLSAAVSYVRANELSRHVVMVHFVNDRDAVTAILARRAARAEKRLSAAAAAAGPRVASGAGSNSTDLDVEVEVDDESAPTSFAAGAAPESAATLLRELPPLPADVRLLQDNVAWLDTLYCDMTIDSLVVRGTAFSPAAIAWLAEFLAVTPGMICMSSPDVAFPFTLSALGGVRVVTRSAPRAARVASLERLHTVVATTAADMGIRTGGSSRPRRGGRRGVGGGGGGVGGDEARVTLLNGLGAGASASASGDVDDGSGGSDGGDESLGGTVGGGGGSHWDLAAVARIAGLGADTTLGRAAAQQTAARRSAALSATIVARRAAGGSVAAAETVAAAAVARLATPAKSRRGLTDAAAAAAAAATPHRRAPLQFGVPSVSLPQSSSPPPPSSAALHRQRLSAAASRVQAWWRRETGAGAAVALLLAAAARAERARLAQAAAAAAGQERPVAAVQEVAAAVERPAAAAAATLDATVTGQGAAPRGEHSFFVV